MATIEGKAVLVTGANRGIGQALVEEALRRGAERVYAGTRQPLVHSDERVTPLLLDVTDIAQIRTAVAVVGSLDVLINNAGIALYDDLSDPRVLQQHLAVNLFGTLNVTQAFLRLLARTRGAIVNNVSLMALSPMPMTPSYAISKAAAFNLTQSLRALLAAQGIAVHAALTGPTDTDMTRGFDIPKASPVSVARAILDGVEQGEEDIFPDPMSASLAEAWEHGAAKVLERQTAALMNATPAGQDLSITFVVNRGACGTFDVINDVRSWWTGDIEGRTDVVGDEFIYRHAGLHSSTHKVTELIPGKRIVWHVTDAHLTFIADPQEWVGTDITFDLVPHGDHHTEVRFVHVGLRPELGCFKDCAYGWRHYVEGSLQRLLATGAAAEME